jgi:predicted DNA-binding transcriptional regulator AlpA
MKQDVTFNGRRFVSGPLLMREYEISAPTFYKWIKRGLLPQPLKIGGNRLFAYTDVVRLLSTGE